MSLALVTGATGFIGSHLIERLVDQGLDVRCLIRDQARIVISSPHIQYVMGDMTQPASLRSCLEGVDYVFHLAGLTKALSLAELRQVNEQGTRSLVEACAEQRNPPVLLLVSSLAAVGPASRESLRAPSDLPRPVSNYGKSKRAAELAVAELANRLPITVVRPPIVFGERDRDCLNVFLPIAKLGLHCVVQRGLDRVSLIHVADLVTGLLQAAHNGRRISQPHTGDAGVGYYFMAFDHHPELRELGRLIGDALGRDRVRVLGTPRILSWLLGMLGELAGRLWGSPMVFNLDKVRDMTAGSWTCDPSSAKLELGFSPGATLPERLKQTADWYHVHKWL